LWTINKGTGMLTYFATILFVDVPARLRREDTGATAVEYGLIAGLIVVLILAAIAALATMLSGTFFDASNDLTRP